MNIIVKFNNIDHHELFNSNSSLSISIDQKNYFFHNTNSWTQHQTENPIIKIEYLCLPNKNNTDIIEIIADDLVYKILCDSNILIHKNNVLSLQLYVDLNNYTFVPDSIDRSCYDNKQIFCSKHITKLQIPSIRVKIYNEEYIFDNWYNYDNSLLFYSKENQDKCNAYIQILNNQCVFYMVTSHEYLKYNIIYKSIFISNIIQNELNQIDCSQIIPNFTTLKPISPILIAPLQYFDINYIDQNLSIMTNI